MNFRYVTFFAHEKRIRFRCGKKRRSVEQYIVEPIPNWVTEAGVQGKWWRSDAADLWLYYMSQKYSAKLDGQFETFDPIDDNRGEWTI